MKSWRVEEWKAVSLLPTSIAVYVQGLMMPFFLTRVDMADGRQ